MSDHNYRRGQIFGFTIAEAVLLLFFSLLLLLSTALLDKEKQIDEYQIDRILRAQIQDALAKYSDDPQKFFIVIEEFRKQAKERLTQLERDAVTYEEYRELMLVLARELNMEGGDSEIIRRLITLVSAGDKLSDSPMSQMSKEELLLMFEWYEASLKNSAEGKHEFEDRLKALVASQEDMKKRLEQLRKERNYLRTELAKFDGKDGKSGFGLPPCWIDEKNRGVRPFVITMLPSGYVLSASRSFDGSYEQRFYERLIQDQARWGSVTPPDEFRKFIAEYKELGLSEQEDKCQFWAGVVDCLPNDKDLYKSRISVLASGFRVFREDSRNLCSASQ